MRLAPFITLLFSLVTAASCAVTADVHHGGFPINVEGTYSIRCLDAAMIGKDDIVVSWVARDSAWVRTLRIDGTAGALELVTPKAWQVRVVPSYGSYQLVIVRDGHLYVWGTTEQNSALLVPRDTLVRSVDAIAGKEGPVCASIGMMREGPDAVLLNDGGPPFALGRILSIPFNSAPSLSMEGDTMVVRIVGAIPDSKNPGSTSFPYFAEGSGTAQRSGESFYRVVSVPERGKAMVERFKARTEPRVQEFRGVPTHHGRQWSAVPPRRFSDPGPNNIRNKVKWFSCERQRDLGMLVDWGMNIEWVRWPGDSVEPVHTRVSSMHGNASGLPEAGETRWSDSTAVLAWVDPRNEGNAGMLSGASGKISLALVGPDGIPHRIATDGLPEMRGPVLLRVLHSDERTIFVWVKSASAVGGQRITIEACAIPDAQLRAQPTIPFD